MFIPNVTTSQVQVVADFTTDSDVMGCGSLVVEFKDLSIGLPDTWLWDFGNGSNSTLQNPTVIYTSPGIYNISLTVSNQISNDIKVVNGFIKVYENPSADFNILGSTIGCNPLSIDLEDISSSNMQINSWLWDFGDGGSSMLQNPTYQYLNDGIFSVSLSVTDVNGCENIIIKTDIVKVSQTPIADFIADTTFSCYNSQVVEFNNSSIGSIDFIWDFGDGTTSSDINPIHTYNSGYHTVTLYAKRGICVDTLILNDYIQVGFSLYPEFDTDISSGCENLLVNFTDITTNNPNTWYWDFGDGNTSTLQNPTNNYLDPGVYNVTLTTSISGQCARTITYSAAIDVFPKPNINFTFDENYGCQLPVNIQFFDNTTNAVSWNWHFSNGIILHGANPIVEFLNYGAYNLSLTAVNSFGCAINNTFDSLVIIEEFDVQIGADILSGCSPLEVNFFDSTNSLIPIIDWQWDFGNGFTSNLQNPTSEYFNSGQFDVKLTVTNDNGCISSKVFNNYISISESPTIDFNSNKNIACVGENISFFDLSTSSNTITNWLWDFGDGVTSSLQNASHQYSSSGFFNVKLIASVSGCEDSMMVNNYIEILDPTAFFEESYNCDDYLRVNFSDNSQGADQFFWDFGDGTTSILQNPIHYFPLRGIYNVTLTVINNLTGCTHEFTKQITITQPKAEISYLVNANNGPEDSVGCVPHQAHIINLSQDCAYFKVLWSDGYLAYGRTDHLIQDTGYIDVSMMIWDIHGCKDTVIHENMYHVKDIEVDFGISNVLGCDSLLVDFDNISSDYSDVYWDFGDGNFSLDINPIHIYQDTGIYDVTLYVSTDYGCKDTLQKTEYIDFEYLKADFVSDIQNICLDDTVHFINYSVGRDLKYFWDFGNGNTSIDTNPFEYFTIDSSFNISLTVTDSMGCQDIRFISNYINVIQPKANYSASSFTSDCPPLISNFTNQSSLDVVSWYWGFGDSTFSVVSNPSHLFSNSGIYSVYLAVENQYGCSDTLVKDSLINIYGPTGSFNISNNNICQGDTIALIPYVENTDFYIWDFGDGYVSNDSIPVHSFLDSGIFHPILVIQNNSGCQKTLTINDSIYVKYSNVNAGLDMEICKGETVYMNALGNLSDFNWFPSLGLSDTSIANPSASPLVSTSYVVKNYDGMCTAFDTIHVLVHDDVPNPNFVSNNMCENDTVEFSSVSGTNTNNIAWQWSFGSSNQNPSFPFPVGNHDITLIVENLDNNCLDTIMKNIEIFSSYVNAGLDMEICKGETVYMNALGSLSDFNWFPSLGLSDTSIANPSASPLVSTSYVVKNYDGMCTAFDTIHVLVHDDVPNPNFVSNNMCENDTVEFSSVSGTNTNNIAWQWSFGSSNQNPSFPFPVGNHDITLIVENLDNNCLDTIVKNIEIFAQPFVSFSALDVCFGDSVKFINDFSSNVNSWEYQMDNGINISNENNPSYLYEDSGTYNPILTVSTINGCTNSFTKKISIYSLPYIDFLFNNDCINTDITFYNNSNISTGFISSYNIDFSDTVITSSDSIVSHSFKSAGVYNIGFEVFSDKGCSSFITKDIEIYDNPVIDFSAQDLCYEDETKFINLSTIKNGDVIEWMWSINETDQNINSKDISYIFNNSGLNKVSLKGVSDKGCIESNEKNIYIYNNPIISFMVDSAVCNGDNVVLEDLSYASNQEIVEWTWDLGDGNLYYNKNIEYKYDQPGIYDISLSVVSSVGCVNDTILNSIITVYESPNANFNIISNRVSELESKVKFFNMSERGTEYSWDFANGDISTEYNPIVNFKDPGNYTVALLVKNHIGCTDEMTKDINIYPEMILYVPDAFTPNGDGINDFFIVKGNSISSFEIQIFNRWGNLVYQSFNIDEYWSGKDYFNEMLENGIYVYNISAYDTNGKLWVYNGEISLLR